MNNLKCKGRVALFGFLLFTVIAGLGAVQTPVFAQDPTLADLAPMGLASFGVTTRLGFTALEFSILTANIGGQDWIRPRRGVFYVMPQLYEYTLFQVQDDGSLVEVDRRRKTTICTIDDSGRGRVFPCIQEHGVRFTCGGQNGVSRGWADDYFRGLNGQFSRLNDNVGSFVLTAELDPDYELDPSATDIPDTGKDATHDNNIAYVYFDWDGTTLSNVQVVLGFDPDAICPQ